MLIFHFHNHFYNKLATILRFQPNDRKFEQITGILSAKPLNYQIFLDAFDSFREHSD